MEEKQNERGDYIERLEKAARSLRRQELFLAFVSLFVGAAYLAVMIAWGSPALRRFVERPTGSSPWAVVFWYLLLFTLLYNIVHFPVAWLRGYVVERRFRLSKQRFGRWLWSQVKKYLLSAALVVALGEAMYFFLRHFEKTWWFWAWIAYLFFGLVLNRYGARAILPLFYKRAELDDDALKDRLRALVERAGYRVAAVKRIIVGADTRKANAAVTGLGSTKEVLVSDTALELLEPGEIEAVLAHEIAHMKRRHGEIMLVVGAALSFAGFVLAAGVLNLSTSALGLTGVSDVAGFPLIVLVFACLFLLVSPLLNYLSRTLEWHADAWGARFLGDPGKLASAVEKLAANNLAEKDQPRYYEILFASHPSPGRRAAHLRRMAQRPAP